MPKQIDWDAVARLQRAQRHGTEYAYNELPSAGSYADRERYFSGDGSESAQSRKLTSRSKPQQQKKKTKPTKDKRLRNIYRTLQKLVVIPSGTKWEKKGLEYQHRLLTQLQSTLNSMLKLDPSKSSDPISIKANRLLVEHGSAVQKGERGRC